MLHKLSILEKKKTLDGAFYFLLFYRIFDIPPQLPRYTSPEIIALL